MKAFLKTCAPLALAAAASFALAGCLTDSGSSTDLTTSGGNVVFTEEVRSMAQVVGGAGAAAKTASHDSAEDSSGSEHVVVPLKFDTTCQCFVRSSSFTAPHGMDFGRSRADSVWLYAGGQAIVDSFVPKQADSIIHIRHVTRIDGQSGRSLDFTARTTLLKRTTDSGTVFVWTGTLSGTLNGVALSGSTFTLVRTFTAGSGFGFPEGELFIKQGKRDVSFEMHGDGSATCTVRRGGKLERTTHIDAHDNES